MYCASQKLCHISCNHSMQLHEVQSQKLDCYRDPDNAFDQFSLKIHIKKHRNERYCGAFTSDVFRINKCGYAFISSVKYRRSPIAGELEPSCLVFVWIPPTELNEKLIGRHTSPVKSQYIESVLKVGVGIWERENNFVFSKNKQK